VTKALHPVRSAAPLKVLTIMGTRPEVIKLAPVIRSLEAADDFEISVASTGQHREMLDQIVDVFGLPVQLSVDIFEAGQTLPELMSKAVSGLAGILEEAAPDLVMVQGDTTSAFAGALSAFYADVPVVHLEAGLRTSSIRTPFPEEMNRRLTSRLTSLHLAPTPANRAALLSEGIAPSSVIVTGNTVIDALMWATSLETKMPASLAPLMGSSAPVLLVTAHRRESWGPRMRDIGQALSEVALRNPELSIVFPMHPNPIVRADIVPIVSELPNVLLVEPLPYVQFAHLMQRAHIVLTDSGGIQEEAPALGKPVLVMRDETEREEAISTGVARLVGTRATSIATAVQLLVDDAAAYDEMARAVNPYGDGFAAERVVQALRWKYAGGSRPLAFVAGSDASQSAPQEVRIPWS
jgi:UDP-N-acetylglucosamine 2-epimerase (non-hydrolysing)